MHFESTIENANEYINKENLDENEKKNAINSNDLHSVSKAIIEKGLSFGADKGKVY